MALFNNIKRLAHEVEIGGNKVFVRSLTTSEWLRCIEFDKAGDVLGQCMELFRCGVCDKDGNTIHGELTREDMERELTGVPVSFIAELSEQIMNVTKPQKKS